MRAVACVALAIIGVAVASPTGARTHKASRFTPPPGAQDGGPTFLGAFKDWSAFSRGSGDARVCYMLSEPKAKEPASAKRDPAYFLINDWPGRRARGEAEVVPGYQYREGSTVKVQVGKESFDFFTKNQGSSGGAWVLNPADEKQLLAAMRAGLTAIVTGTSKRGTETRDIYGLSGMGDALDKIHDACGM
jgi:Invasion associated locus B (IalB) protein